MNAGVSSYLIIFQDIRWIMWGLFFDVIKKPGHYIGDFDIQYILWNCIQSNANENILFDIVRGSITF